MNCSSVPVPSLIQSSFVVAECYVIFYKQKITMQDEELLECVKKHQVLYDMSHPKYMDPKYKKKIWKEIEEKLNIPDFQCKNRWQNIRDQFRKNLAKREMKVGQSSEKIKKYKYEEILSFLLPYLPYYNKKDSAANTESPHTDKQHEQTLKDDPEDESSQSDIHSELIESPKDTSVLRNKNSKIRLKNFSPRTRRHNVRRATSSTLMKYIIDKNTLENKNTVHPIDAFLSGISPILKGFTPYYQHLARGKIFAIVQDLELRQLQKEDTHSWSSTPTPQITHEEIIKEFSSQYSPTSNNSDHCKNFC